MRPSQPVRHFCSFLNQRVFCFALRCLPGVPLEGWKLVFHAHLFRSRFVGGGEESRIGGQRIGRAAKQRDVLL
jgi:hypothetical protein